MRKSWLKYLPILIRRKLENRHVLQAILSNTGWLFADRVLRMGVGLFVGIWVARYLGPEQFGLWNFVIAFTALFGAIAALGLDGIVVRDLVKNPESQNELMGTAFVLKLISGIVIFLVALIAISYVRNGEMLTLWLVGICAAGYIFQSANVVDFYFQSKIQSKYSVYASNGSFILMNLVKVFLLLSSAPLIDFAWVGLGEIITTSIFLILAYKFNHNNMREWSFDAKVARKMLSNSWPLILSGISIVIYMRVDQIMIGQMLGDKDVGIFSAAVRISEIWYFIPVAIVSSVFPYIVAAKQHDEILYLRRLQILLNLMTLMGVIVAILMVFFSEIIIRTLFGFSYAQASIVLTLHIWAGVFMALGVASTCWLTAENLQKYHFYRTLIGAVINVALNLLLIPIYGINGAAVATVVSYGASVFSIGIYQDCRRVFVMMCYSFNPIHYRRRSDV